MNEILKLVDEVDRVTISNSKMDKYYFIEVRDKQRRLCTKSITKLEAEVARHNLLLATIEQCVLDLKAVEKE